MIPVYIGFDPVESGAFWTCASSILENSSEPVAIMPLRRQQLPLKRPRHPKQSNEFAFTRFLVPYLQDFKGHAIFVDCDFLFMGDIADLWHLRNEEYAVQVVKHAPEGFVAGKKYLGTEQTVYEKKCWSSLMLFNCEHLSTRVLRPEYIDTASGLDLHQFKWAQDSEVGALPASWNHLVGVQELDWDTEVKAAHFTLGGPYFNGSDPDMPYGAEWWDAFARMKHVKDGWT